MLIFLIWSLTTSFFILIAIAIIWVPRVLGTTFRRTRTDLTEVPANIPDSTTVLDLSHNDITRLRTNDFVNLALLEELWLTGNCLREIEHEAFNGLGNLVLLALDDNCLEQLRHGIFSGLDSLKRLYLTANKLTSIDSEPFVGLPQPLEIGIWENDLRCDDGLRQIQNEVDNGTIVIKDVTPSVSLIDKFCDSEPTDEDLDCKLQILQEEHSILTGS